MKNVLKIFGIACIAFLAFSCSKDDDPADNDLFVGTYNGSIGFNEGDDNVSISDGSITVVKAGNNYNFSFNDSDIPNLTGVEFENDGDNGVINVDFENGIQYIRITASTLQMLYSKDGKTWTADCER